jgi:hypothetical protein
MLYAEDEGGPGQAPKKIKNNNKCIFIKINMVGW